MPDVVQAVLLLLALGAAVFIGGELWRDSRRKTSDREHLDRLAGGVERTTYLSREEAAQPLSGQDTAGDFLMDWRQGGFGLRYVHHFSEPELAKLAEAAGFEITETFLSDGENSRLGLYQVWQVKV